MANITISKATAEQLFDLFHNVEVADAHYKRCQSDQFRMHVQSVYKNQGISSAFAELQNLIESAREEPKKAATSSQSARKGVLGD